MSDTSIHSLNLDSHVHWQEADTVGRRCFSVDLTAPGTLWLELTTSTPATATEIVLLADPDQAATPPRLLQRVQAIMLKVDHPGNYLLCLTSQAPLGDAELELSFLRNTDREIESKEGNEKEIVIEIDPTQNSDPESQP